MNDMDLNVTNNEYLPLRDVVFQTLRNAILLGKLSPGERLMENHLAEKLGVSRTPVREALRMLEIENLVALVPRKGAQVLEMTKKDVQNILEIRGVLEGLATNLACKRIDRDKVQELRASQATFEATIQEGDKEKIIEADEKFHDIIFEASGNERLVQMYQNLRVQLYRYRMAHLNLDTSIPVIVAHHRSILRAVENQDSEEGSIVAQGHIKYHTDFILNTLNN
ncbi:MAG: GntR family transcriptional regulator [Bacillota bacterium]